MASEFYFDLKGAGIFQAVRWEKTPVFKLTRPLRKLFSVLFVLTFLLFLYGFLPENFSGRACQVLLGFSIIFLTLYLICKIKQAFLDLKLKKPKLKAKINEAIQNPEKYNLAEFLSFESAKAVYKSLKFAKSKKLPGVNSSILFYFLISQGGGWVASQLNFIFSRALLSLNDIKKTLEDCLKSYKPEKFTELYSENFQNSILESFKIAQKKGHQRIEMGDILTALAEYDLIFKKILIDTGLKTQDIENLTWWFESLKERITERKKFWEWKNLIKKCSLAKEWTAGYTLTLDQFSSDWTEIIRRRGPEEIIGSEDEIENIERILSQPEVHNVLLIGEPGTGRKSVIHNLTQRILFGQSLPEINYKRVVALDIVSILTHCQSFEEVESTLETVFQEAVSAGNVILIIDEFYSFVAQSSGKPGTVDISPILLRYLPLPNFRIIGITSHLGMHLFIEKNPTILNYMATVEVNELTEQETIRLLEDEVLVFEQKYKKFISYPAIRNIVDYSNRYIQNVPFPKKALDLLEDVVVYTTRYTESKVVLPEYVSKMVSKKTDIPVGQLEVKEKETLLNLENLIHQRIINQEEAVKEVSTALRRARAQVTVRKGPMGTFLFLGPTGVGKTETSKALAEVYFGSENKMIRLDISEFQNITDIPHLIGSTEEEGFLTTKVREAPFSLILLDEIEKAHPNILNLFLQVLDEGFLTDGLGRKVDFKNSIIIATSNAGYQIILEALKQKTEWAEVKQKILDYLFEKAVFRPEFINRFDAVVVFKPLSKENLLDIAELMLQALKKNLKDKGIEFIITREIKEKIVELGYSPVFGAREMRRVIQDKIENVLASALLSGELKRGDQVEIDSEEFRLTIK